MEYRIDFGYFFCRLAAFYGYADEYILKMSIKRFWLMSKSIDRINADRDIRSLSISANSQSADAAKAHRDNLMREREVVLIEPAIVDKEGLNSLKLMSAS